MQIFNLYETEEPLGTLQGVFCLFEIIAFA